MFRGTQTVKLEKGRHELWIEAPGFVSQSKEFDITQGGTTKLDMPLERVDYGYLVVDGNAGVVEIEIDERPQPPFVAQGEPVKIKLPAGKHKVVLDADGRKEYEADIDIPPGQELPVHANLVDSYPRGKSVVFGVFGVGALVGGIFLHLEAEKPLDMPHDEDTKQAFEITRIVAFATSGLFVGMSVFFAIYDPYPESYVRTDEAREFPEKSKPPAKDDKEKKKKTAFRPIVAPWFSHEAGGLSVGSTF